MNRAVPGRKALSMCEAVGGVPLRASFGMSHLPGSPGSDGELNNTSASWSMLAEVMGKLPTFAPNELLLRFDRAFAERLSDRPTGTSMNESPIS